MRIGIFGGAFNPPHVGHLMAVLYAQTAGRFDALWVIPCWRHAFAKDGRLIPYGHRLRMTEMAFAVFSNVRVAEFERVYKTQYTVDLIERLQEVYPEAQFTLIVGADNLETMDKWHRWDDLKHMVELMVLPRAGASQELFVLPSVSSTEVRASLNRGEPEAVKHLVPAIVMQYIRKNGLYGA